MAVTQSQGSVGVTEGAGATTGGKVNGGVGVSGGEGPTESTEITGGVRVT